MRTALIIILLLGSLMGYTAAEPNPMIDRIRFYQLQSIATDASLDTFTAQMLNWQLNFLRSFDAFDEQFATIETIQLTDNAPATGAFLYYLNLGDYIYHRYEDGNIRSRDIYLSALSVGQQHNSDPMICEALKRILIVNRYSYLEGNTTADFYLDLYEKHAYDAYEKHFYEYIKLMLAFQYYRLENWDESIAERLEAFTTKNDIAHTNALIFQLISTYHHFIGQNEIAISYQESALSFLQQIPYGYKSSAEKVSKFALTRYHLAIGQAREAQKVINTISKIDRNWQEKGFDMYTFYYQSVIDSLEGDYINAFRNLGEYTDRVTVANNASNRKRFEELEAKYQTEQKENEILRQQNEINKQRSQMILLYASLGFLGLFGILSFLYFEQRKKTIRQHANNQIEELLSNQELKTAYAMLEGQDRERKRIATELHDNLGSILVTLSMYADSLLSKNAKNDPAAIIQKISSTSSQANEEVRKISHSLDSGMIKHFGLASAIRQLLEAVEMSKNIQVATEIDLPESMPYDLSLEIYRMIQELVNNTMKHAAATKIRIELSIVKGDLSLIYEDNGRGFDLATINRGMGLNNIQQRVERLNGELQIDSNPGKGSTFIIDIERI